MSYNKESWQKYLQYKQVRDPATSAYWRKYNAYKRLRSEKKVEVSKYNSESPEATLSEQISYQLNRKGENCFDCNPHKGECFTCENYTNS